MTAGTRPTAMLTIRISPELVARIAQFRIQLQRRSDDPITHSEAARRLIIAGLIALEEMAPDEVPPAIAA